MLRDLLMDNWTTVLAQWEDRTLSTYPEGGVAALKRQKDQFGNPVGFNVSRTIEELFNFLCDKKELDEVLPQVEDLIRIRAVQDFSPSRALAFVGMVKPVVKELCRKKKITPEFEEWYDFERKVDLITMHAFDLYLGCRERLFQTRINELRRGTHIITEGAVCPSALMRKNQGVQEKIDKLGNGVS